MALSKNKQAVIVQLKKHWREGARWCAYKNTERIRVEEIKCFQAYSQAARFCEEENNNCTDQLYKVCVITDLLKRIQVYTVKGKRQEQTKILKTALCEKYPPLSFPLCMDHLSALPTYTYFPIIWNRVINPLTDISQWLVTLEGCSNARLFKSHDYYLMMGHFMKRLNSVSMMDTRDELKMEAKLGLAPFEMYIELYRFYYHGRRSCYMLDKKIDVSKPFLLPITCFAKYSERLKRLVFLDENLKKISAGKIIAEPDVRYFKVV